MASVSRAISNGYNRFMAASDQLNADKLANRLVETGHNVCGGQLGGLAAAGVGAAGSLGASALLWQNMNPIDTLMTELPQAVATQTGLEHQILEGFGQFLEAGAETLILANTVNYGVQSVDAAVDMMRTTRFRSLQLKDFEKRPSSIKLDDTRRV